MPNQNTPIKNRLHIGSSYYPEHWTESHWANDIRLMKEAGLTVARMAEFAWSALEPSAGNFEFDWLELAIAQLAAAGIVSVIGTPTAAPPAWLLHQFPDTLALPQTEPPLHFPNPRPNFVHSPT